MTTTLQLGLWQHSPNNKDATDNVGDTFESGLCGVGGRRSGAGGDGEVGECELSATGGTTQASAEGIRNKVLQAHGRWRSERMPSEYNDMVEGDEGAVSRALQRRVQSVSKRRLLQKQGGGR